MSLKFPKEQKLKSEATIQALFKTGKSAFFYPLKIHYSLKIQDDTNPSCLQFGATASKKYFKKAVDRNELKRKIREAFRLQKTELEETLNIHQKHLIIMVLFVGKTKAEYDDIYKAVHFFIHKLMKKIK
ncbi:MAG: ribonuclease P protein component [Saprospiraceae bacterium]